MPVLYQMEFCARDLHVAYRASPAPQELSIEVRTAGRAEFPMAPASMRAIVEAINGGAAGGGLFSPCDGLAEIVHGPAPGDASLGPDYRWTLRVAAVAPLFLRNMVEELRRAGMDQPVTGVSIAGSLPLDASDLSVREGKLKGWLDDRTSYLEAWPTPGFPVRFVELERGANLRVELGSLLTPTLRDSLESLSIWWINIIRNMVSEDGMEVLLHPAKTLPTFGSGRSEFRAQYQELLYARAPARAALVNMLSRFHHRECAITQAEIRL